ncbi:mitotic-spindle organizing protein 2-like [Bombus vosnesenskii]|uniref:Mitotic-spindle organizing protein 2-like n=3 Tax=Pyrobombus TaxID=144703 RepID=A0A6J3KMA4_9HYME|nr:mitotic-spindle organizing protein 2 [Bombus impatiens]XP_033184332.1 mitotic-spindle organizing protein 2-like [Bombus vancouverensis nearcticus]XP_033300654.1 mitotic-spindle organizing protein 2-like [Bombus bifarius]XP_033353351.1 mitotic-spindle organizing protein 2-like [Bombus vosnesenskii]
MTFPQAHQVELIALAELAGISAVPGVYRIILELLALQISPEDIYVLLKQICPRPTENRAVDNIEGVPNVTTN